MKFKFESIRYCFGDERKDMKECYDKAFEYFKDKIVRENDNYYIEIDTIEELMKLFSLTTELIISDESILGNREIMPCVTIYDYYIDYYR